MHGSTYLPKVILSDKISPLGRKSSLPPISSDITTVMSVTTMSGHMRTDQSKRTGSSWPTPACWPLQRRREGFIPFSTTCLLLSHSPQSMDHHLAKNPQRRMVFPRGTIGVGAQHAGKPTPLHPTAVNPPGPSPLARPACEKDNVR